MEGISGFFQMLAYGAAIFGLFLTVGVILFMRWKKTGQERGE